MNKPQRYSANLASQNRRRNLACIAAAVSLISVAHQPACATEMRASDKTAQSAVWRWKDATETEQKGYGCAALMMILTATPDSSTVNELSKYATKAGMMLSGVGGAQTSLRLGIPVKNGYVSNARDQEMRAWAAKWTNQQHQDVVQSASDCIAWASDIAEKVHDGSIQGPADVRYEGPYASNRWPPESLGQIVDGSFTAWFSLGGTTPGDMKEMLRRGQAE